MEISNMTTLKVATKFFNYELQGFPLLVHERTCKTATFVRYIMRSRLIVCCCMYLRKLFIVQNKRYKIQMTNSEISVQMGNLIPLRDLFI